MRKIVTTSLVMLAAAASAPAMAQDAETFGGFYGGLSVGYDLLDDDSTGTVTFDRGNDGSFGETVTTSTNANAFSPGFCGGTPNSTSPTTGCVKDDDEFSFSGRLGYDWVMGDNLVGGLVTEVGTSNLSDSLTAYSTTPASYTFTRNVDYTAALRARLGYATDMGLVYLAGGVVGAKMDNTFATTNTANTFTQNDPNDWAIGYQLGGGAEFALAENVTLGVEYLYNDVSNGDYSVTVGQGTAGATNPFVLAGGVTMKPEDSSLAWHALRAVVNFRF